MSEPLLSHPARDTLQAILALDGDPRFADSAVSAEKYRRFRDRCFALARAIDGLFDRSVPTLASLNGLNQLHSHLQNALNELSAFASNSNTGHLANVNTHSDNAAQTLWAFGPQLETLGKRAVGEILKSHEKTANAHLEDVEGKTKELSAQLQAALKQASDLQSQVDSFKSSLTKTEAEAAAAVAKLDTQFANDERERAKLFLDKLSEGETRVEQQINLFGEAADRVLADLEKKQSEAAKIVQVVGNIGITGNYQRIAKEEGRTANTWRGITVGIFLVGIGLAVTAFLRFLHDPISSESFWSVALRLLFAIGVTGPAIYTAKESARHRTNADRARKLELELASLGPFIELLPEEQKREIRQKLTHVYFGGTDVEAHTPGNLVDMTAMKDILVEVLKAAKR